MHGINKLLKGNAAIVILVKDVEHSLHKEGLKPKRLGYKSDNRLLAHQFVHFAKVNDPKVQSILIYRQSLDKTLHKILVNYISF